MMLTAVALLALSLTLEDTPIQEQTQIDADRPHVGTGTHVVEPGEVQFEIGIQLQFQRARRVRTVSSPTLVRIGATDRVEVRVASDGWLERGDPAATVHGMGNAQLGAKIRLWGDRKEPIVSVMPTLNLGLASREKALGTGETDATLTLLAGHAITDRLHAEVNYGVGSIGDPVSRFPQQMATGAIVHQTTPKLASYVECAWWSRQEPDGGRVSFLDYGVIFAVTPRLLIDGGAHTGLTAATPDYGAFAGLSFIVGKPLTQDRRRRAASTRRGHRS